MAGEERVNWKGLLEHWRQCGFFTQEDINRSAALSAAERASRLSAVLDLFEKGPREQRRGLLMEAITLKYLGAVIYCVATKQPGFQGLFGGKWGGLKGLCDLAKEGDSWAVARAAEFHLGDHWWCGDGLFDEETREDATEKLLRQGVSLGNTTCMYRLAMELFGETVQTGKFYDMFKPEKPGEPSKEATVEAFALLEQAADAGHCQAEFEFGERLQYGDGIKADQRGQAYLKSAAVHGNEDAVLEMANLYTSVENVDEFRHFLAMGLELACLVDAKSSGSPGEPYLVRLKEKAFDLALDESHLAEVRKTISAVDYKLPWIRASNQVKELQVIANLAVATTTSTQLEKLLVRIGEMKLEPGNTTEDLEKFIGQRRGELLFAQAGETKDPGLAFAQYVEAANLGFAPAMVKVGQMHENGEGVKEDLEQAVAMYRKAAEKGSVEGRFNLAVCYEMGTGVEKDETKAAELYQQGVDAGDINSMNNLGVCYEEGIGVAVDAKKAVELYVMAGKDGDGDAKSNLAECYENGVGVERDVKKALELYREAAAKGNKEGKKKVKELEASM